MQMLLSTVMSQAEASRQQSEVLRTLAMAQQQTLQLTALAASWISQIEDPQRRRQAMAMTVAWRTRPPEVVVRLMSLRHISRSSSGSKELAAQPPALWIQGASVSSSVPVCTRARPTHRG